MYVYDHWLVEDPSLAITAPSPSALIKKIAEDSITQLGQNNDRMIKLQSAGGLQGVPAASHGGVASNVDRDDMLYFGQPPLDGHILSRNAFLSIHKVPPREHIDLQRNRAQQPPGLVGTYDDLFDSHGRWVESTVPPHHELEELMKCLGGEIQQAPTEEGAATW